MPRVIDSVVHSLSIGGTILCRQWWKWPIRHFTAELVGRFETERHSLPLFLWVRILVL